MPKKDQPVDEAALQEQWDDARDEGDGDDVTEADPVVDEDYEEDDE